MKRILFFFILILVFPSFALCSQEIFISEAAGNITIPDGFFEIPSDIDNERLFYNSQGECVMISTLYLKDIYPIAYERYLSEGKTNEPLYYDGGGLAGKIGYFLDTYKEMDLGLDYSVTNRGSCAAIKGESDSALMITAINRYEVVSVLATFNSPYSENAFTAFLWDPVEQELK